MLHMQEEAVRMKMAMISKSEDSRFLTMLITNLLRTMLAGSASLAPKRATRDIPFSRF
jgi:hypothetical protein